MGLKLADCRQIFMDTSPFIYYFEENLEFIDTLTKFWDQIYRYDISVITSIITYIELLTLPEKKRKSFTGITIQGKPD